MFDKELGNIVLVSNPRAKHVIVRYRDDAFRVTHPPQLNEEAIAKIIEGMKPKLLNVIQKQNNKRILSPDNILTTYSFDVALSESRYSNYYTKLQDRKLNIICPSGTDFSDPSVQKTIWVIIEKYLRSEAKLILPDMVKLLAGEKSLSYNDVKINKSTSRWGSCSSRGNINLSYKCLLLPEHLISFIILHELCHTVEMNHGEKFWQLLDNVTGGKARALTRELKVFSLSYI